MAIVPISQQFFHLSTSNGVNTYVVGAGDGTNVSTLAIHISDTGSLSGSITVKARSLAQQAGVDAAVFQPIVYRKLYLNGAVGDGSLVSTAITTTSIILVPCAGLQIALDVTALASGTATVYTMPCAGPSVI